MKWKRSRKAKEQVEAARDRKLTNENPASEPQGAGLGKNIEEEKEEEEVGDENDFQTDAQQSEFLQTHADGRYTFDDDVDEMRGGERKMGSGL